MNFYEYENRVVKIEDSSSNAMAEYTYDALGRRIGMIDKAAEESTFGLAAVLLFLPLLSA
ncbi:MAG: RHS repeat protein [Phycisphaerae bacterium]|nr:RHS repeat protein [Phycisphaerae bacterium]